MLHREKVCTPQKESLRHPVAHCYSRTLWQPARRRKRTANKALRSTQKVKLPKKDFSGEKLLARHMLCQRFTLCSSHGSRGGYRVVRANVGASSVTSWLIVPMVGTAEGSSPFPSISSLLVVQAPRESPSSVLHAKAADTSLDGRLPARNWRQRETKPGQAGRQASSSVLVTA